jgi:site-specific recombinase XerD
MINSLTAEFIEARRLRLSVHTIADYQLALTRLAAALGPDATLANTDHRQVRVVLAELPGGKKNKLNAHIAFSAFWTWLVKEGHASENLMRRVDKPIPEKRVIVPLEREEVETVFKAARVGRFQLRDAAILKFMLDTGARASEVCGICISDLRGGQITLSGKGSKQRRVPIGESTRAAIDDYLDQRGKAGPNDPLFLSDRDGPMTRNGLLQLFERLGNRAGVTGVHPHRMRHTFAINYLMNGGDAYTLQAILGHSTMDMVKRYLRITESDLVARHVTASPVRNWNL